MNDRFYALPEEKKNRILNAGYRVFALNSYRKSPMSEIAAEAGISKSLLFHYFRNKKELYLFLWDQAAGLGISFMKSSGAYDAGDFFDMMLLGLKAKTNAMRIYPYVSAFTIRAFYETDAEVSCEIQESYRKLSQRSSGEAILKVDPENFRPGLDLKAMCRQMFWASEGYLWEMVQRGAVDADALERDGTEMVEFWREVYGRKPQKK